MTNAYEAAGVNIAAGNAVVAALKKRTNRSDDHIVGGIGGFAGAYALSPDQCDEPVLVAGADGVGTKVILAAESGQLGAIGQDLLAMCVNDVVAQGALPLFFLDYLAVSKLDPEQVKLVLDGLLAACERYHIALLGGETAEMPGVYREGMLDLAGFALGHARRSELLSSRQVTAGDSLLGLPASGLHSNGFSLVRKLLFADHHYRFDDRLPGTNRRLIDELLTPTRIYTETLKPLLQARVLEGASHITGGGLLENVPRMLRKNLKAVIDLGAWTPMPVFSFLVELGQLTQAEAFQTFNMGIGMVLVVKSANLARVEALLEAAGEAYFRLGTVERRQDTEPQVELRGETNG